MENEIIKEFEKQNKKIDEIYHSVEKTRKYFLWTLIISIVVFVLPLLGLIIILPIILKSLTSLYNF